MKFEIGQLVATRGAVGALDDEGLDAAVYVTRHVNGDWGDIGKEDAKANDDALKFGNRVLSAYILPRSKTRIWILTEADRSSTCVMLPSEY